MKIPTSSQDPRPRILVGILGTLFLITAGLLIWQVLFSAKPATIAQGALPTYTVPPTYTPYPMALPPLPPTYPIPPTYTPQPTYTLLPSLTPFPTQPRPTDTRLALTVVSQGSAIVAGKTFESSGIAIYTSSTVVAIGPTQFMLKVVVHNKRSQDYLLRYTCSSVHLRDDTGKQYPLDSFQDLRGVFQMTVSPDREVSLGCGNPNGFYFIGPVSVQAKYLLLTIDELAGMSNLNWQFDLQ